MTKSRFAAWISLAPWIVLTLASLGCGSGNNSPNPAASLAPSANPLVAQYNISPPYLGSSAWVEFGADTSYGRQTSATPATTNYGQQIDVLVAGMKANTTYHMRAHVDWSDGSWTDQDRTFKTGKIPSSAGVPPQITVTRPTPGLSPSGGVELFNGVGAATVLRAFATDLEGNVIWYYNP